MHRTHQRKRMIANPTAYLMPYSSRSSLVAARSIDRSMAPPGRRKSPGSAGLPSDNRSRRLRQTYSGRIWSWKFPRQQASDPDAGKAGESHQHCDDDCLAQAFLVDHVFTGKPVSNIWSSAAAILRMTQQPGSSGLVDHQAQSSLSHLPK